MASLGELLERIAFPEWQKEAACKDKPPHWFFGEEERPGTKRHRPMLTPSEIARAKEVCASCPVVEECRQWAFENNEPFGVWGGTTPRERKRILEEEPRSSRMF